MDSRTPPHSLEAEMSVLGSIMLDNEVYAGLEGVLTPEHFYKESHRKIFRAMERLHRQGDPVDLVTLTEELRSSGELESVGSINYLIGLADEVPTAAFADSYVRIVIEKATLRDLISASGRIMQQAYDQSLAIEDVLDLAEKGIFDLTTKKRRVAFETMHKLVGETFDEINERFTNPNPVSGIETGFRELDQLTAGLHRSTLNVIAARPSMGKTAFGLNIALHAALKADKDGNRSSVGIFSLEMSAVQLVMRMLCSEARVDMSRVRSGQLTERDFQRLADTAGRLSEASVYIDDNADMSVMELRSRARRLKNEHGLDLLVIDYLQLMSAGTSSRSHGENRQQEISAISRGLKALARELDIPVLVLSQLSRAVESRPNKRPMLSDLRECVTGDTLVDLADGRRVPIADLVGQEPEVLSMDANGKVITAKSDKVWRVGPREVFEVKLASGRVRRTTARHRWYAFDGWQRLEDLKVGDRVGIAREIRSPASELERDPARVALLGQVVVDGSYVRGQPMRYTTASEENAQAVMRTRGMSRRQLAAARGASYGGTAHFSFAPSTATIASYASVLKDPELLRMSQTDLFWDEIVSITPAGVQDVYDLTVPGPASWLAAGVVMHNSGAIEQDADLVMFIYRDEYYDPHSEKHGIAEIIIGKQRNGPTGQLEVQFHNSHVRFNDLHRSHS
ncbi:MAG TPA: replicative DNA helicase [Trueperaceae bacterium]|nr:replicative DNA helicase [Trueperaceae bacterium]